MEVELSWEAGEELLKWEEGEVELSWEELLRATDSSTHSHFSGSTLLLISFYLLEENLSQHCQLPKLWMHGELWG